MASKKCDQGQIKSQSKAYKAGDIFGCSNDLEEWDCSKKIDGYQCTLTVKEPCKDSPKNFKTSTGMTCDDKKWLNQMVGKKTLTLKLTNGTQDDFRRATENQKTLMFLMEGENN